jgi:hypothetical protein
MLNDPKACGRTHVLTSARTGSGGTPTPVEHAKIMSDKISDHIVRQLADHVCQRITKRAISGLQRIPPTLSGDDSELLNAWDEICVQVQFEESFFWHVYQHTITAIIGAEIEELPQLERDAIWLQTERGFDWSFDRDWDDESQKTAEPPTYDPDITDYILHKYLLPAAESWSNSRIRAYLDRYDSLNAVLRTDAEASSTAGSS